ncbi:MAG TPA: hypothetical protein VLH40_08070 [Atribacteraceae bacterium]|nr:hypothetical protein [Atribacteraceae bacterium]
MNTNIRSPKETTADDQIIPRSPFYENLKGILLKGGSLIGLIGLSAFFAITSPHFFTFSNWLNIFRQVSVILILACAQTMVIISAGIDLSVDTKL